jgi:hypothetical protein
MSQAMPLLSIYIGVVTPRLTLQSHRSQRRAPRLKAPPVCSTVKCRNGTRETGPSHGSWALGSRGSLSRRMVASLFFSRNHPAQIRLFTTYQVCLDIKPRGKGSHGWNNLSPTVPRHKDSRRGNWVLKPLEPPPISRSCLRCSGALHLQQAL